MGMGAVVHTEGNLVGVSPDGSIEVGVHEKTVTGPVSSMLFCVGCGTLYLVGLYFVNAGLKLVAMKLGIAEDRICLELSKDAENKVH